MTHATWQRDERVLAYLSERRARYPSIARAADGRQLILFTHQTAPQEEKRRGAIPPTPACSMPTACGSTPAAKSSSIAEWIEGESSRRRHEI